MTNMRLGGILGWRSAATVGAAMMTVSAMAANWSDTGIRESAWPNNGNVSGNVYTINTAAELGQFAWTVQQGSNYLGRTVILADDIVLTGNTWAPAGTAFRGTFDGNGKTITGMKIALTSIAAEYNGGLFAILGNTSGFSAVVRNVRLLGVDVQITVNSTLAIYFGGIAGRAQGGTIIEDCSVDGTVNITNSNTSSGSIRMGGIVGDNYNLSYVSHIRGCMNFASVTGNARSLTIGGIAGWTGWPGIVHNCLNAGSVTGATSSGGGAQIGGITGNSSVSGSGHTAAYLANCLNTGPVSRTGSVGNVGALAGYAQNANTSTAHLYWKSGTAAQAFGGFSGTVPGSILAVGTTAPGTLASTHPEYGTTDLLEALTAWVDIHNSTGLIYYNWTVLPGMNGGYPVLGVPVYVSWADAVNRNQAWPNNGNVSGNTYTINTGAELAQFAWTVCQGTNYLGAIVTLAKDIDLAAYFWAPAGTAFRGTFDGNGKAIYGMKINLDGMLTETSAGLFGELGAGGTVKNVQLPDVDVKVVQGVAERTWKTCVGGIVGRQGSGNIDGCYVNGSVSVKNPAIGEAFGGGIVGDSYFGGLILNCANAAAISVTASNVYAGGIAGYVRPDNGSTVKNCLNMGTVHGTPTMWSVFLGGIVGYVWCSAGTPSMSYIENCFNTGTVKQIGGTANYQYIYVGSLMGFCMNGPNIRMANSYWLQGTAAAAAGAPTPPASVIAVKAPDPGELVTAHAGFGNSKDLLDVLNQWVIANGSTTYLGWVIKAGVNDGYPVLDMIYPSGKLLREQFLHIDKIVVNQALGTVTLHWDPAQLDGTLEHYEVYASDDLTIPVVAWDVYAHDGVSVVITAAGTTEHTAMVTPILLSNPIDVKGFFKVMAVTR